MKSQSGQIVVEYILLLSIAVTIGMIVVSQLVSRDSDEVTNSGVLIQQWNQMQKAIGDDTQD